MTAFLASRSMENFFINPTMTIDTSMETFARLSIITEPANTKVKFEDFPLSEGPNEGRLSKSPSTIQQLFINSNIYNSYHSDEESASPTDTASDSDSIQSYIETPVLDTLTKVEFDTPEPATALDLFLKPEELAKSCEDIEHRCNRAQAITLKPVGKPRVVAVPKLTDSPTKQKKASNESFRPNPSSSESSQHNVSRKSTVSSNPTIPPTTVEAPLPGHNSSEGATTSKQETPRTTSVENVTASTESPLPSTRPTFPLIKAKTTNDSVPRLADIAVSRARAYSGSARRYLKNSGRARAGSHSDEEDTTTALTATPSKRHGLYKFASSFSLSNASDVLKRTGSISSLRKFSHPAPARENTPVPPVPAVKQEIKSEQVDDESAVRPMIIPRRTSSMKRLAPRGATERAPVLVLPPFPDEEEENEEDDDDDFANVDFNQDIPTRDRPVTRRGAKLQKERPKTASSTAS